MFIAPYLLAFFLFMVVPAVAGLYVSLTNWGGLNVPKLIGPANYLEALNSHVFWQTTRNTVYYTVLGQNRDHNRTRAGLESARAHLRSVLGQQVRMKFTPALEFQEDVGLAQVERVTELLRQIESTERNSE